MTQTLAIFLDAYRELNARKLFWITLAISGLVVVSFAFIGINQQGLRVMFWDLPIPGLNSTVMKPETFYKLTFTTLGINVWLSRFATILALVSTAGMFPDFISAGSIDLVLSKPIGRLRLFLTKYTTGLMFVGLQVTVFSIASFFVLGVKGKTWEPAVFLAIPVVTIFFSYLFCICVLLGLTTRSTIAALLLTLLVWLFIFALHVTESGILAGKLLMQQEIKSLERSVQRNETAIDRLKQRGSEIDFAVASAPIQQLLDKDRPELDRDRHLLANLEFAHNIAMDVMTALPKTTETVDLLGRWLVDLAELPAPPDPDDVAPPEPGNRRRRGENGGGDLQREALQEMRSRSVWWVMGTSVMFEVGVLAIAAWIFCRRDF